MGESLEPMSFLNSVERRVLGPLVARLCSTGNARFQRAIETTGAQATVRMACVNTLRIYAMVLFVVGMLWRLFGISPLAVLCLLLAVMSMAWSFWCLYTVVGPERAHKRMRTGESRPAA